MEYPVVTICGRPNVGKSTLFNTLIGERISIVDPTSGVTRDRITHLLKLPEGFVELVDTGGIGLDEADRLSNSVRNQISLAIKQASIILFVVDIREGITPLDKDVAEILRREAKECILVANKADNSQLDEEIVQFWGLGMGEPIPVSANEKRGLEDLLETIGKRLPQMKVEDEADKVEFKMAIVGKRNVGKSTLLNAIAKEERMIVSEIPGTTRDSVDVRFEKDNKVLIAIDTAGIIRSKRKTADSIEFYSQCRAEQAIRRCDVALLIFDATQPVSNTEKKIADLIQNECKPCVIVVNKWDLAKGVSTEKYGNYLSDALPNLSYSPIVFITAKIGKNVQSVIDMSQSLIKQANMRISTSEINQIIGNATKLRKPKSKRGRTPKVYYATQVAVMPPTIILFVNDPSLFGEEYKRFLTSYIRDASPFKEIPVRLEFRPHRKQEIESPKS